MTNHLQDIGDAFDAWWPNCSVKECANRDVASLIFIKGYIEGQKQAYETQLAKLSEFTNRLAETPTPEAV